MSTANDTRSPITDALETLGMIHYKTEKRDAIHLAVEPVKAGEYLEAGDQIGIIDGTAYLSGTTLCLGIKVPYQGIVDPFLNTAVKEGERFWFVMKPREVRSLRHVWFHPDFPAGE